MLPPVKHARLGAMVLVAVAMPLAAAACGDDSGAVSTLPPLLTTTVPTTTIAVSTTTTITYYKVQSGDTLSKIANRFNVDQADLMAVNGITNPDHVEIGQELKIPPPKQVVATLPPTTTTIAP